MADKKRLFAEPPATVLVLRFSSAGDIILASPAIDALHTVWPRTRILYAVKAAFAPLVAHDPAISQVITTDQTVEPIWQFAKRLKALEPDVILDLHGKLRTQVIRALMPWKIPRVIWQKRPPEDNLPVRLALRPYSAKMYIADRYHAAVEELVGEKVPFGRMRYFMGPEDSANGEKALVAAGIDVTRPILGMSPGANWETKRWPVERFAEVARRAHTERGMQIVITGSKSEAALGDQIAAAVAGTANLAGKIPLATLAGVISRCTAFVANDSGPMHMARSLGVPTLAFFGSTDPKQFVFDGHAVLFAGVPCAPCHFYGRRRCPKGHFKCMLDLTPDMAWNALTPLVQLGGARVPFVRA